MRGKSFILSCVFASVVTHTALAAPFSRLWVFGDSTVDTGWYRKSPYSGAPPYDAYIKHPSYGVGRPTSSPGLMSVEVLGAALAVGASPQNQGGTNYATGGARDRRPNNAVSGGFPNAVPTETQIDHYLAHHNPGSTALYLISSGDNDVAFALKNTGSIDPRTYIKNAANSLAEKIKALTGSNGNGAKYIIVVGLPESYGTPNEKQQLRHLHNVTLQAKLTALGVPYIWGDVDALRTLIESFQNQPPSPFGITQYTTASPACPQPQPNQNPQLTITTDWAYVCSPSSHAATNPVNADVSEFADDNHWATGAQSVLGSYFYCLAKNSWATLNWPTGNTTLPFDCSKFPLIK
jgi:outer membrane lipase/esterase